MKPSRLSDSHPAGEKLAQWLLWGSATIAAVSVFGYKVFTLNPIFLSRFDWAMQLYPYSYKVSAQTQILLGCAAVIVFLSQKVGKAWIAPFLGVFLLSFCAEFMGTSWGIPFGKYEYTELLGFKLAGKVPWLIPCSWFFMGIASYRLSLVLLDGIHQLRGPSATLARCGISTLLLVLWDVTLDPAMSYSTPFWLWEQHGNYFGMPAINVLGWLLTGFLIMLVFELVLGQRRVHALPVKFFATLYAINIFLPLGILLMVWAWLPLLLTIIGGVSIVLLARFLTRNLGHQKLRLDRAYTQTSRTNV